MPVAARAGDDHDVGSKELLEEEKKWVEELEQAVVKAGGIPASILREARGWRRRRRDQ